MIDKRNRVLVVDDMPTMRKLVRKYLKDLGFMDVVEADDGQTALPMVEKCRAEGKPVGLVISDWNMPRMKGIELLKKIRASSETRTLPFILLTAEAEKEPMALAKDAGVDAYLQKPFTAEMLSKVLDSVGKKKAA